MAKRILLAFFSEFEASKMKVLISMMSDMSVDIAEDLEKAKHSLNNNRYEFIILDHKTQKGNFFIEDILALNEEQKIILLSDTLKCPISCDECLNNFNFLRLVKPVNYQKLIPYLRDESFECSNKYVYGAVDTLDKLNKLLFVKDNLVYNQKQIIDNKLILSSKENSYNNNFMYKEFEVIENAINNGFFKIKLIYDNTIEIEKIEE